MSIEDRIRQNYDAARQEILYRMQLRDQALLLYLTIVGAIFGISFGLNNYSNKSIALIIPFIALSVAILISQHYVMAAALGEFCTNEIEHFMKSKNIELVPQWDNSQTFCRYAKEASWFRVFGHLLIIGVPCFLALLVNRDNLNYIWIFSLICLWGAITIILYAQRQREKIYARRRWHHL